MKTRSQWCKELKDTLLTEKVRIAANGKVTAQWEFYYTHGHTTKKYEDRVLESVPGAKIVSSREHWSFFEVVFTLPEGE